jgi:inorganic pyrophosphatase
MGPHIADREGHHPPSDLNVFVEIPKGGHPSGTKESGAIFVDRFLHMAMFYPSDFGLAPHTLSEDGDPIDVLIVGPVSVVPGTVMRCRPVGALLVEDEAGPERKNHPRAGRRAAPVLHRR